MRRIGELARMAGVSDRTLRHHDKIGLLTPAAVDRVAGYRWHGVAELTRLERSRGRQRLGLPLRRIADLVDATDTQVRQAPADTVTALRQDIAARAAAVAAAEDHLATRPRSCAAVATGHGAESRTLPARDVVRAVVPGDVVRAGHELFDWLRRQYVAVTGPTLEEHLTGADGSSATVLEIPVAAMRR